MNADDKRVAHDETVGGATKTASVRLRRTREPRSVDGSGRQRHHLRDGLARSHDADGRSGRRVRTSTTAPGRLTAQTDAKTQRTTFGYDALDCKTSKTTNAGTGSAVTVSWTYDQVRASYFNIGTLTTMSEAPAQDAR